MWGTAGAGMPEVPGSPCCSQTEPLQSSEGGKQSHCSHFTDAGWKCRGRVSKECRWGSAKFGVSEGQRKPQGCSRHLEIRPRGTRSLHPACPPYLRPTLKWHLPHDRLCKKHLPPHQVTADINLCSGKRSRLLARALIQPTQNCKEVRICAGPRQGVFIWRMYSKQLGFECWTLTNKSQTKIYSQRLLSGCFW